MKKLIGVLLMLLFLFGCTKTNKISPQEAKKMMEDNKDIILVDVRNLDEYESQRIANALLIPLIDLEDQAKSVIPDNEATYIVYCRSGRRSAQAVKILTELGYKHVYDLGGIISWPYETITK